MQACGRCTHAAASRRRGACCAQPTYSETSGTSGACAMHIDCSRLHEKGHSQVRHVQTRLASAAAAACMHAAPEPPASMHDGAAWWTGCQPRRHISAAQQQGRTHRVNAASSCSLPCMPASVRPIRWVATASVKTTCTMVCHLQGMKAGTRRPVSSQPSAAGAGSCEADQGAELMQASGPKQACQRPACMHARHPLAGRRCASPA